MHRKTAVKKENWLLIGDWYIHPDFDKLTSREGKYFYHKMWSTILRSVEYELPGLLAHKCADGKIGRLLGGGAHKSKRSGLYRIYGKCFYCKAPVSKEIHTLINLLKANIGSVAQR